MAKNKDELYKNISDAVVNMEEERPSYFQMRWWLKGMMRTKPSIKGLPTEWTGRGGFFGGRGNTSSRSF